MEPEFVHMLVRVCAIGGVMAAVGFTILFFAFRAFGRKDGKEADVIPVALVVAVLAFVMACCLVLVGLASGRH